MPSHTVRDNKDSLINVDQEVVLVVLSYGPDVCGGVGFELHGPFQSRLQDG